MNRGNGNPGCTGVGIPGCRGEGGTQRVQGPERPKPPSTEPSSPSETSERPPPPSFSEASDWSTVSMVAADCSYSSDQWTLILMSATGSWSLPPLSAQLRARVAVELYYAQLMTQAAADSAV